MVEVPVGYSQVYLERDRMHIVPERIAGANDLSSRELMNVLAAKMHYAKAVGGVGDLTRWRTILIRPPVR